MYTVYVVFIGILIVSFITGIFVSRKLNLDKKKVLIDEEII